MKIFIPVKLFFAAAMLLAISSVSGLAQSPGFWETNGPRAALSVRINGFARLQAWASDTIFAASSEGVLFSQDAGLTWQKLPRPGNRIALLFNVEDTLYVLRDGSPYKSIDAGATWPSLSFAGLGAVKDNLFAYANGTLLVVTQQNSIYFSRNGGRDWQQAILPGIGVVINSFMAGDSLVFVGTEAPGLLMSSDSGGPLFNKNGEIVGINLKTELQEGSFSTANNVETILKYLDEKLGKIEFKEKWQFLEVPSYWSKNKSWLLPAGATALTATGAILYNALKPPPALAEVPALPSGQ